MTFLHLTDAGSRRTLVRAQKWSNLSSSGQQRGRSRFGCVCRCCFHYFRRGQENDPRDIPAVVQDIHATIWYWFRSSSIGPRSEEHTSELQSLRHLVCRLLLEKKTYS